MIVHGSSVSPFVRKVIAFAAEKGVALENRQTRFGDRSDEWMAKSPFGKIPAFEDGDYVLADSSAIVHYIEAKHTEPNLIPTEAKARGKAVWFDEYADTIFVGQLGMIFFNRRVAPMLGLPQDLEAADKAEAELLPPHLAYLESVIPASGFLVEDRLTLADIAVASPFANMAHAGVVIDGGRFPTVSSYIAEILARPSFAQVIESERKIFSG
jgi:glutathione S-transferase